jgi:nicotinate-nucleotide adenylyltransferase
MAAQPLRVGVFGGTFNPIHLGHLVLAEEIRGRLGLDRVLFVPSGRPPHKADRLPSGRQRLAMVRLAVADNPSFEAIDLEVRRDGKSYTIETLRSLARRYPAGTEFCFLIGMDAFEEIATWHEAGRLADYAHFAVFPRPGHPLRPPGRFVPAAWAPGRARRDAAGITTYPLGGGKRLLLVPTETLSLAASTIRARVALGASITYLVPAAVERFIGKNGLYRNPRKGA